MLTIKQLLASTATQLATKGIPSSQLDAEVMLSHVLDVDRAWLIAHGDDTLESVKVRKFESLVKRRLQREPVAYVVGHKEFYGREFIVTPDVLIPRPESETIIDHLKKIVQTTDGKDDPFRVIDVGCGSGCLGISAKLELPQIDMTLCDISKPALAIARQNAVKLHADVNTNHSDLLSAFLPSSKIENQSASWRTKFDFILANLPYVDRSWQTSPELGHEPDIALYANDQGLELIKTLITQASNVLVPSGHLLLEADPCQHAAIAMYGKNYGFELIDTDNYVLVLARRTP